MAQDKGAVPEVSSVNVPEELIPIFKKAEDYVRRYFSNQRFSPEKGSIEISGERYILVRAASMSIEFFDQIRALYADRGEEEARRVANGFLFDIAHSLGTADARCFSGKMNVTEPLEMLSAGPIHFAHAGWAFVDIDAESSPTPDENYLLVYDHPYSFEADAWLNRGSVSAVPVCIMNAGYSSGWCGECYGLSLVAVELTCRAMGDLRCHFIMAPPTRIQEHLERAGADLASVSQVGGNKITIPEFFQRKRLEEEGQQHQHRLEELVQQRTAQLVDSEERYRTLVEWAPDAIVVLDADRQCFIDVNQKAERLFGLDREALCKSGVLDLSPERQPDGRLSAEVVRKHIEGALNGEQVLTEWLHRDAHGRLFLAEVHLLRLPAVGRRLIRGSIVDITDRRAAEEQRLELERGLLHKQKLESLGLLAGGIAHDFNNLLMPLLGHASLILRETDLDPKLRSRVERIELASKHARDLIRQLLAYAGRGQVVPEPLQLNQLIRDMSDLLDVSIPKKATLTLELQSDLPLIVADSAQLTQVIMNLIVNAGEAIGDESGQITLSTAVEGESLLLTVRDTGCGISEANQARLFEPFFSTKFVGRGLGLAAVQGIVWALDGKIELQSAPGSGTTFLVRLPMAGREEKLRQPVSLITASAPFTGRVLVIDDEPEARSVLGEMLTELGCETIFAVDGRQGLDMFQAEGAELLCTMLDITMPVMSGSEVLLELRKIAPDAPVIMISGYSEEDVASWIDLAGPTVFLQKPFAIEHLGPLLQRVCSM